MFVHMTRIILRRSLRPTTDLTAHRRLTSGGTRQWRRRSRRHGVQADPARVEVRHLAQELLDELRGDIRATIDEVRRVAYALRPPALDQLGLAAALRQRRQKQRRTGNSLTKPLSC